MTTNMFDQSSNAAAENTHGIEFASLANRFLACLIDCVILGIPSALIVSGTYFIHVQFFPNAICLVLGAAYSVGFLSSGWQATPEMRLLKMFVARAEDAGRLSRSRALMRYLAYNAVFLSFVAFPSLNPRLPANMWGDEARRYEALYDKDQRRQPMTTEDQQFLSKVYAEVRSSRTSFPVHLIYATIYELVIVLMIGVTKQGIGLHDLLCKTRVYTRYVLPLGIQTLRVEC